METTRMAASLTGFFEYFHTNDDWIDSVEKIMPFFITRILINKFRRTIMKIPFELKPLDHKSVTKFYSDEINKFLSEKVLGKKKSRVLPLDFDFSATHKDGRLSTRIENLIYKTYNVKVSENDKAVLGNILKEMTELDRIKNYFVGVREVDWKNGDYGDSGSCYWSSHKQWKDKLVRNDGKGFVLHNKDNKNDGRIGRSFVVAVKKGELYCLFNWNTFQPSITPALVAKIFCATYNKRNRTDFTVSVINGIDSNNAYANGNTGYLIGKADEIEKFLKTKKRIYNRD